MAPLDRAFALTQRDDIALPVCQELNLDVPRALDVALTEDRVVAEGRLGLSTGGFERRFQLCCLADDPHPAAAAAGRRLDHQWIPELLRGALRNDGNSGAAGHLLCFQFVTPDAESLRRRPDEDEPCRLDRLGEVRVLRQEAVPRVDRVRAGLLGGTDVLLGIEVAADLDGLVGSARVQRALVVRRGDGDRGDPELARRPEDPDRDLAAIRYEELPDFHAGGRLSRKARRPFLAFVARTHARGELGQLQAVRSLRPHEALCLPNSGRTGRQQLVHYALDHAVETGCDLGDEPDAQRDLGAESLTGEEVAPRRPAADLGEREGRDHRRDDPQLDLREPEDSVVATDGNVAARSQATAAAEAVPLDAGDHGCRTRVDGDEHAVEAEGVLDVLLVGEVDRRALPLHVRSCAERLAVAAEEDRPRVPDVAERLCQLGDELGVEGVAALGPRQCDAQHRPISLYAQPAHAGAA